MTETYETLGVSNEEEIIKNTKLELKVLKESFTAEEQLKHEVKLRGFYNGDENGENISFNISKVKEYLESIKNKSWSDLDVKSSELEKGVRTMAIQIAINYINMANGESTNNIDWIDGIRGNKTWKGVKEFQTKYGLKNKDGLPGRETINKILALLGNNGGETSTSEVQGGGSNTGRTSTGSTSTGITNIGRTNIGGTNLLNNNTGTHNKIISGNSAKFGNFNFGDKKLVKPTIIDNIRFNHVGSITSRLNTGGSTTGSEITGLSITGKIENGGASFRNRLNAKANNKGGIEGTILKNTEVQTILTSIVDRQGQYIEDSNKLYLKKMAENKDKKESGKDLDLDIEAVQSLEDYKHKNSSPRSFEEFVSSDEGIAIITNEIQAHIDTNHKNGNDEYDSFYENYPISGTNLEIKLRAAWENKMLKDYYRKSGIYGDDEQLSEEERKAKEEEMEKLEVISNQITGYVDKIIGDYMKSDKGNFDQNMISELESLLSKGTHGATIEELFSDQNYKDTFKGVLRDRIKIYGTLVRKGNNIEMNTGDKQIDLQLRSYLYIYGRIFYSDHFGPNKNPSYYEEILPDIMRVIMSGDDASLINTIKHKEFLELEEKLEKERKERDLRRRQEAARRNRERNNYLYNRGNWGKRLNTERIATDDINEVTGAEIVERSGIDLSDIKPKGNVGEMILNSGLTKQKVFETAWEKFKKFNIRIENGNDSINIEDILTPRNMRDLYDIETKSINENARKIFCKNNMEGRSQEDIDKIYNELKKFPDIFSNTFRIIAPGAYNQGETANEEIKIHALGEVIDNVRDIFDIIVEKWEGDSEFEGFKFDNNNPVKREGDDIIMSGTFNGTNIKIRYNLKSGGLFINSFLQTSPGKIIIGNNTNANIAIGELDPFDTILDKHYRTPDVSLNKKPKMQYTGNQNTPNQTSGTSQGNTKEANSSVNSEDNNAKRGLQSFQPPVSRIVDKNKKRIEAIKQKYEEMLYAKIDMIGDKIMENTKRQSAINSTVTKFMKTFNIILDGQENKSIEFNNGGDLFDLLEIINNSDPNTLDKFQLFMKEVSELSGLNRGSNNLSGPQENLKSKNIFNDDSNKNKNISLLRNCGKDFSANIGLLEGKSVFESTSKFGFAQIVKGKLTDGTSKPNRKLDERKMSEFFKDAGLNSPL